eukprot:7390806-Prymnesium_polylepis.1
MNKHDPRARPGPKGRLSSCRVRSAWLRVRATRANTPGPGEFSKEPLDVSRNGSVYTRSAPPRCDAATSHATSDDPTATARSPWPPPPPFLPLPPPTPPPPQPLPLAAPPPSSRAASVSARAAAWANRSSSASSLLSSAAETPSRAPAAPPDAPALALSSALPPRACSACAGMRVKVARVAGPEVMSGGRGQDEGFGCEARGSRVGCVGVREGHGQGQSSL